MRIAPPLTALLLTTLAAPKSRALDIESLVSRFDERTFTARDGLPQATVTAITQTSDGYLWVGTEGGLARFDGQRFTVWSSRETPTLRIPMIRSLAVGRSGDLWITTHGGAGIVRSHQGVFETFEEKSGLKGNGFFSQHETRAGVKWFGTWWGAMSLAGGAFTKHRGFGDVDLGPVHTMAEDTDGSLWFGTLYGMVRFDGKTASRFNSSNGASNLPVSSVLIEPSGALWAGTRGDGLFFRARPGERFSRVPNLRGAQLDNINALARDHDGNLWVGTDRGLARVNNGALELPSVGALANENVLSLFVDREHNLWAGTRWAGLTRLRQGAFASLPISVFAGHRVISVTGSPDGTLWLGTDGAGLVRYRNGEAKRFTTADGLCTDWIWTIAPEGPDVFWIGGDYGARTNLCRFDAASGKVVEIGERQGLNRKGIQSITVGLDQEILVGSVDGLYRVTKGEAERVEVSTAERAYQQSRAHGSQLLFFPVHAVHRSRNGDLWLAAPPGLHRLHAGKWSVLAAEDGVSNGQVFSIDEDGNGDLWLATLNGFSRVRDGKVTGWKAGTGFRDGPVYKVLPDLLGDLWVCANDGVYRVTRFSIEAYDSDPRKPLAFSRFGREDGLQADVCAGGIGQADGWRSPEGVLWFLTGRSAVSVDPSKRRADPPLSSPLVEDLLVDGQPVPLAPALQLAPGRGDLRIGYTSIALARPELTRFRYRLDPFDAGWVEAGERREAYYTNVPPGQYRFQINAAIAGTPWSARHVTGVSLTLAPHVHERRSVQAAAALLLGLLIYAVAVTLHRRRLRAVEARHEAVLTERIRISRDLHDTLGQGFTGIAVQLEAVAKRLGPDSERARDNLDRARSLVRSSLADARRAVWDLRPEAVEQGDLVQALSALARGLSATVPVRVQTNGQPRPIPASHGATLLRIGQEAMTNAVKHAGATGIALEVSFLPDAVELRIVDDGKGFEVAAGSPQGHMGLQNLHERAAEIGARLTVESRPGHGTEIVVRAPLPRP